MFEYLLIVGHTLTHDGISTATRLVASECLLYFELRATSKRLVELRCQKLVLGAGGGGMRVNVCVCTHHSTQELKPRLRADIKTFKQVDEMVAKHKMILLAKAKAEENPLGTANEHGVLPADVKTVGSIFDDAKGPKREKAIPKFDPVAYVAGDVYVSGTPSLTMEFDGAANSLKVPYCLLGGNQMHKVNGVVALVLSDRTTEKGRISSGHDVSSDPRCLYTCDFNPKLCTAFFTRFCCRCIPWVFCKNVLLVVSRMRL